VQAAARELLGYPQPIRVPAGVFAEQAVGISLDEFPVILLCLRAHDR
jgi:hypothetical protein